MGEDMVFVRRIDHRLRSVPGGVTNTEIARPHKNGRAAPATQPVRNSLHSTYERAMWPASGFVISERGYSCVMPSLNGGPLLAARRLLLRVLDREGACATKNLVRKQRTRGLRPPG